MEAQGQTGEASGVSTASVSRAGASDAPSAQDRLGFEPHVAALAAFLSDPATRLPLTVSIEGGWGTGKSSFMRQLEGRLARAGRVVRFNAWRHDKDDSLWAAFALHVTRSLRRGLPAHRRLLGDVRLVLRRFRWGDAGFALVRVAATWLLAVLGALALFALWAAGISPPEVALAPFGQELPEVPRLEELLTAMGLAGSGLLVVALTVRLARSLSSPVEEALQRGLRSPDYGERVAFVERFHEDFQHVLAAYVGKGERVFVFLDDLDRCDVPRAADLLQAINLLIPEDGDLVFVLGMDREKVAAGLAVKHAEVLPYLSSSRGLYADVEEHVGRQRAGMRYGDAFIEKFIQVPFRLPKPGPSQMESYLDHLTAPPAAAPGSATRPARRGTKARSLPGAPEPAPPPAPQGAQERREAERAKVERRLEAYAVTAGPDSPVVKEALRLVAPVLEHNPRRLKQFLNLFRIRMLVAAATGRFHDVVDADGLLQHRSLTPEQLAKFLAMAIRWPVLVSDAEQDPALLHDLQEHALSGGKPEAPGEAFARWAAEEELLVHLREGCWGARPDDHDLRKVSHAVLVENAPPAKADARRGPAPAAPRPAAPPQEAKTVPVQAPEATGGGALDEQERRILVALRGSSRLMDGMPSRDFLVATFAQRMRMTETRLLETVARLNERTVPILEAHLSGWRAEGATAPLVGFLDLTPGKDTWWITSLQLSPEGERLAEALAARPAA